MKKFSFAFKAKELIPYIDWSYFFHAWGIKHRDSQSAAAQQVKNDALAMLAPDTVGTNALFALCDARSEEDNIIIEGEKIPLLRQQHRRSDSPNLCLSDFISPVADKIGLFATSTTLPNEPQKNDDPYTALLAQTIADRLSEAAATLLHKKVRTEKPLWGYAPDEQLTIEQLNREEYCGIRPAVGYPSLPDQSIIFIIDKLLNLSDIGIFLTESGAMLPHASVCGLMLSHPKAEYFAVGSISDEQFRDYALRRGLSEQELKRFLTKNKN